MPDQSDLPLSSPSLPEAEAFTDAAAAVGRLVELYETATGFLRARFAEVLSGSAPHARFRAVYPEIRFTTVSHALVDSRLSFGHVAEPGTYVTTVTRPDLFANYLRQQIGLLLENHGQPVMIGPSTTPIPIHFAMG
ncbi:AMP nucleosidase, partial [Rhodovulum sulfidophilum]|nr:AMP nucleosidase [Rhodovulum sulfidophilum]